MACILNTFLFLQLLLIIFIPLKKTDNINYAVNKFSQILYAD